MSCSDRLQNHNLQNSGHQPVTSTSQGVDAFSDCVSVDTNINEAELGKAELDEAELGGAESGEFSRSFQCVYKSWNHSDREYFYSRICSIRNRLRQLEALRVTPFC